MYLHDRLLRVWWKVVLQRLECHSEMVACLLQLLEVERCAQCRLEWVTSVDSWRLDNKFLQVQAHASKV